jgi:acetate---CoA ligase (ADP-forming)
LLKEIVHSEGSINNPVDLLPGGTALTYKRVIEILLNDNSVDSVVMIFVEPVMVNSMNVISETALIKSSKPVLKVFMPLPEFWTLYKNESPSGEPVFRNPEDPSVILANMWKFAAAKTAVRLMPDKKADRIIFKQKNGFLGNEDVLNLSRQYSLPLVQTISLNPEEIESVKVSFPVVLKAGGEEIIHKTELRGVELNIRNKDELLAASKRMIDNFSDSGVKLEYFILQPQIKSNYEILIGGFRDPDFGPMVMFGTGGKYVEFYKDVSVKSAFLTDDDILDMINSTVMGKLLPGVRGEKPIAFSGIKKIISSVAQLMLDYNNISELDLNPLLVAEDNTFHIVDIRIKAES